MTAIPRKFPKVRLEKKYRFSPHHGLVHCHCAETHLTPPAHCAGTPLLLDAGEGATPTLCHCERAAKQQPPMSYLPETHKATLPKA